MDRGEPWERVWDFEKVKMLRGGVMEDRLRIILKEYIENVENVCNILIKSINSSENLAIKNKYDFYRYRANCKPLVAKRGIFKA